MTCLYTLLISKAMEDHTSEGQLHVHKDVMRLQQENEGLKEQVEVLKMQVMCDMNVNMINCSFSIA